MALGRDFAAIVANRFGGRIYAATFVKETLGAFDPQNAAGPPPSTPASYSCDAISFAYDDQYVDGENITRADYRTMILRGTIKAVSTGSKTDTLPGPSDSISVPPPGKTTPVAGTIVRVEVITEAFVTVQVRGPRG